jgi:hypothetical protein
VKGRQWSGRGFPGKITNPTQSQLGYETPMATHQSQQDSLFVPIGISLLREPAVIYSAINHQEMKNLQQKLPHDRSSTVFQVRLNQIVRRKSLHG